MLTPQDIREKEFTKAVFGGYDMASVDDFLEELMADYAALYKENAILKSKIKVLVEKVEEYRSTEDAMRMALLTAQKMGDDIIDEANKKRDEMVREAEEHVSMAESRFKQDFADEEARLNAAKNETAKFVQESRDLISRYEEFLGKLDSISASDIKAAETADEIEETIRGIDDAVENAMSEEKEDPAKEETGHEWTEDDEFTTPRPKFDFDDLKFGSNYSAE